MKAGEKKQIKWFSKRPAHWHQIPDHYGGMDHYMGKKVTIAKKTSVLNDYWYFIVEDNNHWFWLESDFEDRMYLEDNLFEI